MSSDHNDGRPVGFLGKVRGMKLLTWLVIVGLVALTVGGVTMLILIQQ